MVGATYDCSCPWSPEESIGEWLAYVNIHFYLYLVDFFVALLGRGGLDVCLRDTGFFLCIFLTVLEFAL